MASGWSLRSAPSRSSTHRSTVARSPRWPASSSTSSPTGASRSRGSGRSVTEPSMAPPTVSRMTATVWTPYADLDDLMAELVGHWERILGDDLAGGWIQGSFALGAGDQESDCDWIAATHGPLTDEQVAALREVHDEIPTRDGHWPHDIEGSYAPIDELASVRHLGATWLFNDHGHRTLEWDDHYNRVYTRWILREHGITLVGPEPRSFMEPVPEDLLRQESAAALPTLLD